MIPKKNLLEIFIDMVKIMSLRPGASNYVQEILQDKISKVTFWG